MEDNQNIKKTVACLENDEAGIEATLKIKETLNIAYMLKSKNIDVAVVEVPHKEMKADIYNIISDSDNDYISLAELIASNVSDVNKKNTFMKNNIKFYINNKKISNWDANNNMEFINYISKESTINI